MSHVGLVFEGLPPNGARMTPADYKGDAARAAVKLVESGMKLGLGTGSTATKFVDALAQRVKAEGMKVLCVPTSEATRIQAAQLGLRLSTLDDEPMLDLTIDGADEIDDALRLIKGGGGALLREKIVATASARMVVIADHSKRVVELGAYPLPVEVIRFGLRSTAGFVQAMAEEAGCEGPIVLRTTSEGQPFITENGNFILDCAFGRVGDPEGLAEALQMIPGVVEHGLFLGLADTAIIAGPAGIETLDAEPVD